MKYWSSPRCKCVSSIKPEASIPCSYSETDLSTETVHYDHMQVHVHIQAHPQAEAHWGYHISTPLLCKGVLKMKTSDHPL